MVLALFLKSETREHMGEQTQLTMEFYFCELPRGQLAHLLEGAGRLDHRQAKGMPVLGEIVRNVIRVKIEVRGVLWG